MSNNKILVFLVLSLVTIFFFSGCTKVEENPKVENNGKIEEVIKVEEGIKSGESTEWESNEEENSEEENVELEISFTDASWDGIKVPEGQQCKMFEGNGSSPELLIENIPDGTKTLKISYNDRTFAANDNGGHGIIGVNIENNQKSVTVPTFEGESFDLPENVFAVENFRSNRGETGVYLPPCSGGIGNEYYISIQALDGVIDENNTYNILGEGTIEMGIY